VAKFRIIPIHENPIDVLIWDASAALEKFGPQAKPAVPTLLSYLTNHYASVRQAATNALLKIAPEALTNALPE
jgi:hypothetical protein